MSLLQELVRVAIDRGSGQLDFGQNSYYLKGRLGAEAVPLFIYLRYRKRLTAYQEAIAGFCTRRGVHHLVTQSDEDLVRLVSYSFRRLGLVR